MAVVQPVGVGLAVCNHDVAGSAARSEKTFSDCSVEHSPRIYWPHILKSRFSVIPNSEKRKRKKGPRLPPHTYIEHALPALVNPALPGGTAEYDSAQVVYTLCCGHQAVQFDISQQTVTFNGWEGNPGSVIALAMRYKF